MRITASLALGTALLGTALLGGCVDQAHDRASSSGSPGSDSSDRSNDGSATTVFVTVQGNPTPVFVAYRDGVDGPWRTPTRNAGGISYAIAVHDAYEFVAVCINAPPFPGFDAESIYATASDGGQGMDCGESAIQLGGGGGGGGVPPPPPQLAGTVVEPGFVTIGPFNDFNFRQADWTFTDSFVVSAVSDVVATDGSNIDIVRDIKTPADGVTKDLGTIDIDKDGAPFATYTATTSALDSDETAQVRLVLDTGNGTENITSSTASLSSQVVPQALVGPHDAQEVNVAAIGPQFTSANGFVFPDLRTATALRLGNTDPLPTKFDLLERLFPAWSRDAGGATVDLRAQPGRADTIELASENTQVSDGNITALDVQNLVATPAFLAAAGTALGFDVSAPGYQASWVVPATTMDDGQRIPTPTSLLVSWTDPDTGTLLENENDMPEPGEQAFPPPLATAPVRLVRHARDRFTHTSH
jgi:hypothetical protein